MWIDIYENDIKIKWYLVCKNSIDLILTVIMLRKFCKIGCQNSNFWYFHGEKPNETKYLLTDGVFETGAYGVPSM